METDVKGITAGGGKGLASKPSALGEGHLTLLTDEDFLAEYGLMLAEDGGVKSEAITAFAQMSETPFDHLDKLPKKFDNQASDGIVGRRAPLNPLASPKLGKYRIGQTKAPKVEDPALEQNPLRGRLVVTLNTSSILMFVFLQSLLLNYYKFGKFHAPKKDNGMFGPQGEVLQALGGLDTNLIRAGQTVRVFWAMWMHSGWLHIGMNVLCQLQFFYMFEPDWGFWRTFILFFVSGISGNLMSANADPCSLTVGSSGGLYGLMGAMIVYCIEFWNSIPRPACILVFTLIVVVISFLTGFTSNTDNWAHLGGLLGGLLFCLGTITTLSACQGCMKRNSKKAVTDKKIANSKAAVFISPEGVKKKKKLKRVALGGVGKDIPRCRCGLREWICRILGWSMLFALWFAAIWFLWVSYEYQPLGHITFSGRSKCCCCYKREPLTVKTWHCEQCDRGPPPETDQRMGNTTINWEHFCDTQFAKTRRLDAVESSLHQMVLDHPLHVSAIVAESRRALSYTFRDGLSFTPRWLNSIWSPPASSTTDVTDVMTSSRYLRGLTQADPVSNITEGQDVGGAARILLAQWIHLKISPKHYESTPFTSGNWPSHAERHWEDGSESSESPESWVHWLDSVNSPLPLSDAASHKD